MFVDRLTLASTSSASGARVLSPAKIDTAWPASSTTHAPLTSLLDRQLLCDCGEQLLHVL